MRASLPLVAVFLVAALSACATPVPDASPAATPGPTSVGSPGSTPTPAGEPTADGSPSPESFAPSPGGGDVIRDNALLSILPPDLDGAVVTAEDQAFDDAVNDAAFRRNVARAVFPIVVAGDDLASGVIAELTPGRYTDEFFRDWRDSYNAGACGQAGGVAGNAQAEMDGRTVHIATCAGGLRVYHAYIEERNVIVSLFSIGEGRFGERLMGDLRP